MIIEFDKTDKAYNPSKYVGKLKAIMIAIAAAIMVGIMVICAHFTMGASLVIAAGIQSANDDKVCKT